MDKQDKNVNAAKSVIALYEIKDESINQLSFKEVWEKYVASKVDDVACRNILSFDMSSEDLAESLGNIKDIDNELLTCIEDEYKNGANYMFVNPVAGSPVAGFLIEPFLLKAKS